MWRRVVVLSRTTSVISVPPPQHTMWPTLCCTIRAAATREGGSSNDHRRLDALRVWNLPAPPSTTTTAAPGVTSKALQFVMGSKKGSAASSTASSTRRPSQPRGLESDGQLSGGGAISSSDVNASVAAIPPTDIQWSTCERMDFFIMYDVPSTWSLREQVRENHVNIQCFPDRSNLKFADAAAVDSDQPWLHGITISCYAYNKSVEDASPDRLLDLFLRRFGQTCEEGSLNVLQRSRTINAAGDKESSDSSEEGKSSIDAAPSPTNWVDVISSRVPGAVCTIAFEPKQMMSSMIGSKQTGGTSTASSNVSSNTTTRAKGMCRAFYSTNKRFHYIAMAAVPEAQFDASERLIAHTLLHVMESKATKGTHRF